ncbi:transfer protein [Actinocorallia populi]|uniref:transfer protein n=1 Tax=Actinocorallia populi TaxID=2079200 RepID=UPI000D095BC7|nr:transfer protein [Actinocorallia populi]
MSMMLLANAEEIVELRIEVPQGQVIRYDLTALCSALDIADPTRIAVETDGVRRGLITIYPSNPLAEVRPVAREDLVMDKAGRITVGRYHNGRPVKKRLFDVSTGSAQRFLLFGTTGAGKSRTLQLELAAEKINGIVVWLADLKGGQSVPEAKDNVDWPGDSLEEAILMLRAAVAVIEDRRARYSAMGRSAFVLNDPDPLLHVRIDEANRLLEKGSAYRDEGTYLIREIGRTGRSVGVGIGLAAQASHLEELGGSDTLRAMLKEGEVTLLRWSSSMMRQLVSDGLLPAGEQLMPIPKTLRARDLTSQFDVDEDDDEEDGPGTQGTGYLLSGPRPTSMMRHFRIGPISPSPGLDPEILALYGDDEPPRLEAASHKAAGEAYKARHDREAIKKLCDELRGEQPPPTAAAAATDGTPPSGGSPAATRLDDRVLAVLGKAENPMDAEAIFEAVNADGGKTVRLGSVRNALIGLANNEAVTRPERGLYAPA